MKPSPAPAGPAKAVEVAAGLVFRDGKLLITRRHPKAHLGGLWEFPGGKRHESEAFESCLERELMEELGIRVRVGPLVESITHAYPEKTVHLRFFHCQWLEHEPQALDCADFSWISKEELGAYEFPAADARLLKVLGDRPELWG
jgi:8-oxo-dGTP diphosphatase